MGSKETRPIKFRADRITVLNHPLARGYDCHGIVPEDGQVTELASQLVPGQPVKAIEVSYTQIYSQDWLRDRVRSLRVYLHTAIQDTRMVKRMVTALPSLESLWLPVFDSVRGPLARLSWRLISIRILYTSSSRMGYVEMERRTSNIDDFNTRSNPVPIVLCTLYLLLAC
jgi:hypothetical protein